MILRYVILVSVWDDLVQSSCYVAMRCRSFLEPVNFFDCVVMCEGGPSAPVSGLSPRRSHQARRVHMAGADAKWFRASSWATAAGECFLVEGEGWYALGSSVRLTNAVDLGTYALEDAEHLERDSAARKLGSRPSLASCERAAKRTAHPD